MEIMVRSALMADKIKELLDGKTIGGVGFSFVEKKGMDMTFSAEGDTNEKDAAAIAKNAIKSTDYGKGIYFTVVSK